MEVPLLIDDFLRRPTQLYPEKTAVVDGERRFSYRQLEQRVYRMAHALLGLGLEPGDRVCILSPNSHYFLESFYATSLIGVVLVPLNYRLVAADHEFILNHAGVKAVLADAQLTGVVDDIRSRLPSVEHWIEASDVRDPDVKAHTAPDGWTDWESWIGEAPAEPPDPVARDENDLVSINYTSGTTARPKGVMLTHRNCYINAYSLIAHLRVAHEDVELWTLPMFHCNGWGGVYAVTGMGGTHVVVRTIEPKHIFGLIESERTTFACLAPTVLQRLLDLPDKASFDVRSQMRVAIAGAPPPATFIERVEKELNWEFMQIYGLTETAPYLTGSMPDFATPKHDFQRRARAGVSGIGVELQIQDDEGNLVPKDDETVGEVCARSNVVFKGYWEQPEETARAIVDGFFHTGDLGVWDETGSIHITDRKKDVIISGGENISSPEIEDVLYRHSAVRECAVIGVPHEKWGETPKALVVLRKDSEASEEELLTFCRDHMAHFKCPTSVEFRDQLPRTATGKLQKFRLREPYWEGSRRVR